LLLFRSVRAVVALAVEPAAQAVVAAVEQVEQVGLAVPVEPAAAVVAPEVRPEPAEQEAPAEEVGQAEEVGPAEQVGQAEQEAPELAALEAAEVTRAALSTIQ